MAGAAAMLLLAAVFVLLGVRSQRQILDSEKWSDYYMNQMMKAVKTGNVEIMYPLYTPSTPRTQVEQDYDNLVQAWSGRGDHDFEKTGIRIRTTHVGGKEMKEITCAYAVDVGSGQKSWLNTIRIEQEDGNSGLVSVVFLPEEPPKPYGTIDTISRWNIIQWGLFAVSLAVLMAVGATAGICYRDCRRFKWLWMGLILLLYVAPRCVFVFTAANHMISMGADLSVAGFSSLIIYPSQMAVLRIRVPLGMMLYWGLFGPLSSKGRTEDQS